MALLKAIAKAVLPESLTARISARRRLSHDLRDPPPETALLPDLCGPQQVAIDVGAHLGIYTVLLSSIASKVIAFEPNPAAFRDLLLATGATPGLGSGRLNALQVALSDRSGKAHLRFPGPGKTTLGTIEPDNPGWEDDAEEVSVPCEPLDSYGFENVGFIKIDVEGHELAVLQGAEQTIERCRPSLLIEAEGRHRTGAVESVAAYLSKRGYRGSFLLGGVERPLADFLPEMQDPLILTRGKAARRLYVNDFIFRP